MIKTHPPESVGLSPKRMNEIDTAMQEVIDEGKLAGASILIARFDKVAHLGCYGHLDITANKPVGRDSLFRIASMTKPIVSVAALMLNEEGHFNLDDSISKWIPEFKDFKILRDSSRRDSDLDDLKGEITFWHLLTHTSGLGYGFWSDLDEPIEKIYRDAKLFSPILDMLEFPLPELVKHTTELPLCAEPGTTWHYSLAHDILGHLIHLISGKPFDIFLKDRIFGPLGMHDTSFHVPQEKLDRFGPLYGAPDESGLPKLDDAIDTPFVRPETVPSGGGGLVSSITDYYRFMLMLANDGELDGVRLLKTETVNSMTSNHLTGNAFPIRFENPWPGMGFGLGIGVGVADVPKIGWIGSFGTGAWYYPDQEMILIAMTQALQNLDMYWMLEKMALESTMD